MGIARHEHLLVLLRLLYQFVEERLHLVGDVHQLVAREELQVDQHLVVARAAGVNLLSHVAEAARQQHLHLRVDVLDVVLDGELAALAQLVDVLQLGEQHGQLVFAYQSDALKHRDVGHRAQYVVLRQIEVHLAVAAHGEPVNLLVYLKVLFPELHSSNRKLHIFYFGQRVGNLLNAVLQRTGDHTLDERVQLGLHRYLHLARLLVDGQHLHPDVEGHGRLCRLKLHALGLLALDDAQLQLAHGGHVDADGVGIEREVLYFVLRYAVAHLLQVAQVADVAVDRLLRVGNLLHATLKL